MSNYSPEERLLAWCKAVKLLGPGEYSIPIEKMLSEYMPLKQDSFKFIVSNSNVDLNMFNPLSKVTTGNPWTAQYDSQNLLREIKLDVDRTYQEIDFYSSKSTGYDNRNSLSNILFTFSKVTSLPYRQGMNELVAIIFQAVFNALPNLNRDSVESVAYMMFRSLMINVGHANMFYQSTVVSDNGIVTVDPSSQSAPSQSPILSRCERLFDRLSSLDNQLHKHLLVNEVSPNLFLLRWIRLMFSREFSYVQIPTVWDFLVEPNECTSNISGAIDNFAIAMIISVRSQLLASDNAGCFTLLLKYPPRDSEGLTSLVRVASAIGKGQYFLPTTCVNFGQQQMQRAPSVANYSFPEGPRHVVSSSNANFSLPHTSHPPISRRDKILIELLSVIKELKESKVKTQILSEIAKLESIAEIIRNPSAK